MSDLVSIQEHPILMSCEMVRAILAGHKTQTRRVIAKLYNGAWCYDPEEPEDMKRLLEACPYGKPGDRLWVREAFAFDNQGKPFYRADEEQYDVRWKPSIHMPRAASRITLEVVSVKVGRVQSIIEEDAKAEGIVGHTDNLHNPRSNPTMIYPAFPERDGGFLTAGQAFECLWDSINAKRGFGWDTNPWVWVIEFKRVL